MVTVVSLSIPLNAFLAIAVTGTALPFALIVAGIVSFVSVLLFGVFSVADPFLTVNVPADVLMVFAVPDALVSDDVLGSSFTTSSVSVFVLSMVFNL